MTLDDRIAGRAVEHPGAPASVDSATSRSCDASHSGWAPVVAVTTMSGLSPMVGTATAWSRAVGNAPNLVPIAESHGSRCLAGRDDEECSDGDWPVLVCARTRPPPPGATEDEPARGGLAEPVGHKDAAIGTEDVCLRIRHLTNYLSPRGIRDLRDFLRGQRSPRGQRRRECGRSDSNGVGKPPQRKN